MSTASCLVMFLMAAARTVTLGDAERTADASQPQLRQAHANTQGGGARADLARAPVLPDVKLEGEYRRTTGNRTHKPGSATNVFNDSTTFNWFEVGAVGSWVLWDFGQTRNRWHAAEASAQALAHDENATHQQVMLTVRAAYFGARAGKTLVGVARQALANQERHLGQIEGFVAAGTRPEIDLAQARADRANARIQLIDAENGYANARAELNQAMGVGGPIDYDVSDEGFPPVDAETQPVSALVDEALQARASVAALNSQIQAQTLARRAARGGYWPTISLVGAASEAGTDITKTAGVGTTSSGNLRAYSASQMAWNFFGGVTLVWPIFQGFATDAQVRESDAALAALQAQRDALMQQIWAAVEKAQLAVRAAQEALLASAEVLTNARERLRLAEGRYEAGAGSVIELGDAQLASVAAGAQQVATEYRLATARAQLLFALGRR